MTEPDSHMLDRLYQIVVSRHGADPASSYTAKLFARGRHKIAQKVGEEAVETVIEAVALGDPAADPACRARLVSESADLLYHLTVLWADADIDPDEIWAELSARHGGDPTS